MASRTSTAQEPCGCVLPSRTQALHQEESQALHVLKLIAPSAKAFNEDPATLATVFRSFF